MSSWADLLMACVYKAEVVAHVHTCRLWETCLLVLSFCGEQHPHICKESGQPEGGVHRPYQASQTSALHHTVGLSDSALWIWPILNAAS